MSLAQKTSRSTVPAWDSSISAFSLRIAPSPRNHGGRRLAQLHIQVDVQGPGYSTQLQRRQETWALPIRI